MTFKNIMKDIVQLFDSAVEGDFQACAKRAADAYGPFVICRFRENAASCSNQDILIDPASIAQEIRHKPLRLNKKDADPHIVAQVVALYTALQLVSKGCHITETKDGFLIQMYKDPDTLYLSTSDIKARISQMRVEYVQ